MSARKCASCGDYFSKYDDGYWAEGYSRDVCQECYRDIVEKCEICGDEDVMPSRVSEFITCKVELASTSSRPPGVYRVLRRPFILGSMLGGGSLSSWNVLFIDILPQPDSRYEISGHICSKCADPYAKTMRRVYGRRSLDRLSEFNKSGWKLQRDHTRATILAHPEILLDLDCDIEDSKWQNLKKLYDLPDGFPTYRERLFLKYKGITVFRCYENDSAWLTLRPEPKYRNPSSYRNRGFVFDATALPTWRQDIERHQYGYPVENRRAVIEAIDQGILNQDGVLIPPRLCVSAGTLPKS